MPDLKDSLLKIVSVNVSVPGLVNDTLDQVLEPALMAVIAKSETKLDDIVAAALLPLLKAELKKAVKEAWEGLLVPASEEVLGEPV